MKGRITKGAVNNPARGSNKICAGLYPTLRSRYLPIIANYVLKNNGTEEDAKDLFHDAMIVFMRKCERQNLELRCSPQTFLFSIAKNLWMKRLRSKKRHFIAIEKHQFNQVAEPELSYSAQLKESNEQLLKAFKRLSCPCRRILNFFYFHHKRYEEIVPVMKISNSQVAKNFKMRCMQKLRKQLLIIIAEDKGNIDHGSRSGKVEY